MKKMPVQYQANAVLLQRRLQELADGLTDAERRHAIAPLLTKKLRAEGIELLSRQIETLLRLAEEADHEKDSAL